MPAEWSSCLPSVRSWKTATAEEIAFGGLAATAFSLAFSIALAQVCAGVCLLAFIVALARRQTGLRGGPVTLLCAAFVVVAVMTSLFGWAGGLSGVWQRTGKLLWFALLPAAAALAGKPGRGRRILVAFVAGTVVSGLKVCIRNPIQAWSGHPADYLAAVIDKGSMTDGQILMLGTVVSLALAGAAIRAGRRVPACIWMSVAIQVAALLVNFKRGSWFCALILGGAALAPSIRWQTRIILAAAVAGTLLLPPVQTRLSQLQGEFTTGGGGRLTMWFKVAPRLIHERPMGIGYGGLTNRIMRYADRHVEPDRNHLHSNIAQILVETGWIGLALYAVWMAASCRDHLRWLALAKAAPESRAVAMAFTLLFAGLLLNGVVEYNFGDTELMMLYGIAMGVAAGGTRSAPVSPLPEPLSAAP